MGICYLSLLTKPLNKLWLVHSFKTDQSPLPLPQLFSWQVFQVTENLFAMYNLILEYNLHK